MKVQNRERDGQPCAGCARPTQAGSPLFGDRTITRTEAGDPIYQCRECGPAPKPSGSGGQRDELLAEASRAGIVGLFS
jgi:hypothetical protein